MVKGTGDCDTDGKYQVCPPEHCEEEGHVVVLMQTDLPEYLSLGPIDTRCGDTATCLISRTFVCL